MSLLVRAIKHDSSIWIESHTVIHFSTEICFTIGQVAEALTLVLFLLCVIVRFSVASTPGLATTPEDAIPILGGFPSSGFDERSSFSAVQCTICLHVAFK